ncbi:hypothetical protein [Agrobacterium vitis]|uniref:hypothetical protein n=1 Tax=Agrobacterium vitis TaxID=373 RepID=UPI001571FD76|nr:hypothetical protein [Agrobacterium vitis]NSZ16018.1 hypothetical protein [Agrobacterium vitis]QZO04803.1 hypothetical protein K4831_04465 [Agrobacterium vitis]UJL86948.1 hypothetical protein AVF2S5_02800 [Agrobacterium vitis]BCH60345.1 hypothetical protein RvVAR0630_29690 [Agrobacterium vitis]
MDLLLLYELTAGGIAAHIGRGGMGWVKDFQTHLALKAISRLRIGVLLGFAAPSSAPLFTK